ENSDGGPFPFSIWTAGDPRPEFQPGGGANVGMGNGTMQLFFPGLDDQDTHPAFAGDDLRVLVMQITTEGDVYGQFNVTVYPGGQDDNPINSFVEFDSGSSCFDLDPCVGEYDECGVCAGPGAIYECGCSGPEEGFCDCDGNMLDALGVCGGSCEADVDMDGVCDADEIPGCDEVEACNYDEAATDNDGSCVYAEQYYDCNGTCLMDTDGDGVCDELEIAGCLDEMACNYDPTATDDSGMCTYPEEFLDCNGDCMNDVNDNDICDELETFGCVDELACNYNAEAAFDDGSCEYAEEYYDCEGECLNDTDGDGVCDELEIVGCMQLEACNWNEDATEPDDSCEFPGDACDDGDDTTINDVITADCDCVGEVDRVDEFTRWGIALFPTPVQDVMHLQFRGEAQGVASLVIQNAAGRIIRTDQIQGDATVDVSTLSGGVYFVSVEGAWGAATRRVVLTGGR
ncbi:MAG: T9SS type A sorting domain-containing protein, partial [Bacteroidota bacterium]|nr:T9SS type A sorting domain-containing protein [Bacteroidota bacterium]